MLIRRVMNWLGLGLYVDEGSQTPGPGSYATSSAAPVTFDTAMQLSAVWACTRLISETIASLPLRFYTKTPTGNVMVTSGEMVDLFTGKVNRYQTKNEFFETYLLNLVLTGNAYALKQFAGNRIVGLLPLMSAQMETRLLEDGSVVHLHHTKEGVTAYSDESVWHSKLFGNGIVGLSPLAYARNTVGIGLAAESRVSQIYRNGGKPTGVLMIDKVLTGEQRTQLRNSFRDLQEGNGDRIAILEADMKYQQVSMSPQDIQLLESRRFQIEDIARFFGCPSVLINDTESSTVWGSGIQQIVSGFYKLGLRPHAERLEASMVAHLAPVEVRRNLVVEFDFDDLLRAEFSERMEGWQKAIQGGVYAPNEARTAEGMQPKPGGDELMANGNMVPLSMIGRTPIRPQGGQ